MSSGYLREFVNERLTAAAQEILGVFKSTIVKYEEELDRQRRLLAIVLKPRIRLHRIELPQQHVCKEEEVLSEQQLCIQERNSSVDQEDPEPPQIKEEEELCTSQEGEQLELMQETDASMLIPTHEERDHSEDQTLNFNPNDTFNTETTKTGGIRFYGMSILKIPTGTLKLRSCKICGKDFINRACLKVHMRSHSVERLFPCITCGKDFRHRSSVMDHMRLANANEKT
ncbi:uncharacterized protein LOC117253137 [Epinephelus lanceolatus]